MMVFGIGFDDMEPKVQEEEITCCRKCVLEARNVDIYYWPEPNTDQSCLDIVGSDMNALDNGATTGSVSGRSSTGTWWGCTAWTSISRQPSYLTYITTATIKTVASTAVKVPLHDPWSPVSCMDSASPSTKEATAIAINSIPLIHQQSHSLFTLPITKRSGEIPESTAVFDNYTLYANRYTYTPV